MTETPAAEQKAVTGPQVTDGEVDLDLDADPDEAIPPYRFRAGGRDWSVPYPGVGAQLDAEHAVAVSDFFEIVMGEDGWAEFEPVFRELNDGTKIWKLAVGMARHFKMDPDSVQADVDRNAGNRAQRRAGRRPVRRGR